MLSTVVDHTLTTVALFNAEYIEVTNIFSHVKANLKVTAGPLLRLLKLTDLADQRLLLHLA